MKPFRSMRAMSGSCEISRSDRTRTLRPPKIRKGGWWFPAPFATRLATTGSATFPRRCHLHGLSRWHLPTGRARRLNCGERRNRVTDDGIHLLCDEFLVSPDLRSLLRGPLPAVLRGRFTGRGRGGKGEFPQYHR